MTFSLPKIAPGDKILWGIFLIISFLFIFSQSCFAQVVINEFLPDPEGSDNEGEWVELYNLGDKSVDLNQWKLKDAKNRQLIISEDSVGDLPIIKPKSWLIIYRKGSSFTLNNADLTEIKLYDASQSSQLKDSVKYEGCQEGISWGRIPDGTGELQNGLLLTLGQSNQILPTPTSIPTPLPTPTATPEPEPTSTPTPTFTPSPTPTKTPTPTPSKTPTPTPKVEEGNGNFEIVLGESDINQPEITPTPKAELLDNQQESNVFLPLGIIAAGVILMIIATWPYLKKIDFRKLLFK